jgi:arginine decarboxylase-like protein
LLETLGRLHASGHDKQLTLLHFHIGSQVTEIRRVKRAVREAARIYAKVASLGAGLRYLDVGGGLGIDYDGSRTSSDASLNYSVREYANDVVYTVKEVCDQEEVTPPVLLSESGRMLAAYHSVLVTDVRAAVKGFGDTMMPEPGAGQERVTDLVDARVPEPETDEPQEILEMRETAESISVKNYREFYHDALEYRERLAHAFDLGLLSLRQRAQTEEIFWSIVRRAVRHSRAAKFRADEFVDLRDEKEALEVHELRPGEPYRIAFLLLGAYQDTMGDLHNLFGRVHEAEVTLDDNGVTAIGEVRRGESAADTLSAFGFSRDSLDRDLKSALDRLVKSGQMDAAQAEDLLLDCRRRLDAYTYLN